MAPVQSPTALYVTNHGKPQSPHGQHSGITLYVSSTPRHCRRGLVHSFQFFSFFFSFVSFFQFVFIFPDFSGLVSGFQALFPDFRLSSDDEEPDLAVLRLLVFTPQDA